MTATAAAGTGDSAYAAWLEAVVIDGEGGHVARDDQYRLNLPVDDLPRSKTFPASFIRRAIVGHLDGHRRILSGIKVRDMKFTGDLHLANLQIDFPLFFLGCTFEGPIRGGGAKTKTLGFTSCVFDQGADLRNAYIDGHLFLRGAFRANGPLILRDLRIEGTLDLRGGRFLYDPEKDADPFDRGAQRDCLGLSRTEAAALMWARDPPRETAQHGSEVASLKPQGLVTLRDVKVRAFTNDLRTTGLDSWPEAGKLILDGFTYDRIDDSPCETLLQWLNLQDEDVERDKERPKFSFERWSGELRASWRKRRMSSPTPYFQLASVLEKQGRKEDAARIRARVRRNEVEAYAQPKRLLAHIFFWPVDYGASARRALGLMGGLFLLHLAIVDGLGSSGRMIPAVASLQRDPCHHREAACKENLLRWWGAEIGSPVKSVVLPPGYPEFEPFHYSLEAFVPVLDFEQHEHWEPHGDFLKLALALLALLGLFFGSLSAAAVTGLLMPRQG